MGDTSDIVIKAEKLGKKYTIGHQTERERYIALRDVLMQNARTLWHKTKDLVKGKPIIQGNEQEEVWALKDVCFEILRGETVGIIGRNGAGKTTLLKILSRITEPSTGRVTIKGRVASLLEVGTGFHPELTGRENIYLNGAILGMTRAEIKRKFDEIVAFAEVEKFLDTPVKRYSSGMYVRLAFAVAAHLEPEILVVDEVLAVGDAEFQKKCISKMGNVAKEGRTILFVSHNIGAIRKLCNKSMMLNLGQIVVQGDTKQVVEKYIDTQQNINDDVNFEDIISRLPHEPIFKFNRIEVERHDEFSGMRFCSNKDIVINFDYEVNEAYSKLYIVLEILDNEGNLLAEALHNGKDLNPVPKGSYISKAVIPGRILLPGIYEMRIWSGIFGDRPFFRPPITFTFEIVDDGLSYLAYGMRSLLGRFVLPVKWYNRKKY